jgi:hypothetical protein
MRASSSRCRRRITRLKKAFGDKRQALAIETKSDRAAFAAINAAQAIDAA